MASEIRVNQIQNRIGLTTTTFTDTGVTISGILTVSENLNVGGVVTYEDVTNVDAIGIVTARAGINLVGNDLNVGSNIKIGNASGIVTATSFSGSGANLTGINADLVNDTSPQLGGNLDTNSHEISLDTSHAINFGDSNELRVFYHSGNGQIDFNGTTSLQLKTPANKYFQVVNRDTGDNIIQAQAGGVLQLYHNGAKKFDTTTTGIRVHGDEGGTAQLQLLADEGDDNPDYWRFIAETNGILNIQDYGAGSWYNNIRLTGNTGGVQLFHNNSIRAETIADGFKVSYSDDSGATTLKLENNSTHNSQNPKVKIAVDLASGKDGGSIEFIRGNNYQSSAAADSEIVISPTKNDNNQEAVRITQDWFRLHSNCSGIQFNSDTSSNNALNDYEEGTYTAHFAIEGQSNMTMSGRVGEYLKVGRLVTVMGGGTVASVSGATSGTAIEFSNLPFPVHNTSAGNGHPFAVKMFNLNSTGISNMGGSAPYGWIGRLYADGTHGRIEGISASGAQNAVNAGLALASNSEIHYMFTYITDA